MRHLPDLVDERRACAILGGDETPIHRATLWRGIKAGRYPAPIKVGAAMNRWLTPELLGVRESAAAKRARRVSEAA